MKQSFWMIVRVTNILKRSNEFANKHNLKVVRRENKEGFKAGNLNNFLNTQSMTLTNFILKDYKPFIF